MTYIDADYKNTHKQEKRVWKEIKTGFTHFAENDVAIAKISPCFENRKSVILHNLINGYGAGTTELFILRTTSVITSEYLLWIVKTDDFINAGVGNFSGVVGQQRLAKDVVENYLIPLPPFEEQQRIVSSINDAFSQINLIENNSTDLQTAIKQAKSKILDLAIHGKLVPQDPTDEPAEELLKRIATSDNRPYEKIEEEPFEIPDSWKWVKLNDLAEIARGGSPRPIQDYITDSQDGINWIKIGDTSEESKYITSAKEKIKPEGKKHSRFVHAGDFLLTNSMSFGRPYILKIDGCIHDGWLVFANIKECLLQDYLYYALSSAYIYETFSNVAAGSTVKNLKSDTVKQVDFPLPPLSEQKRIVEAIENMYEVLDQIQNNLV
jgi:type I restriction enzyme S subunit